MFTVAYYSYKGGVGRTLALANTAYSLATDGEGTKVAVLDFDLEAPGIDKISPFQPEQFPKKGGIVEYIANYLDGPSLDPEDLPEISPYSYPVKGIDNIRVIPAGKKDRNYQSLITTMNWSELYQQKEGYRFIEQLKERIRIEFAPDYLLIDSRTGLADISGITTHQMADIVVLVFNLNRQNLDGIKKAYRSISESPKPVPVKTILVASPVPRDLLSETDLVGSRLREASESMPRAVNSGSEGKDEIAVIPYHPLLSVDDFVFVKDYPGYDISKAYKNVTSMILKNNPDEIRFLLDMAFKYYQENLLEEAEEEFNRVISKYPENAKGYYYYGEFLTELGRLPDAAEQLSKACRISQNNSTYLAALGAVLSRQGKNESALETFLAAEELSPKNESILQNIANLYYKLDNSEKHIEYIKKLTQTRLPITKADRVDPLKEFEALFPAFLEAELHFPKKFNRKYFWDALKGAIRISFLEKANIITSILERKTTYFQTNQLLKTIKKEQEKFRAIFGEKCNLIYEKIKTGDLKDISDEITLRKIIKKEASDNANVFRKLLSGALTAKNKYKEAADTLKDILAHEPNDHFAYGYLGNMLTKLADLSEGTEKKELLNSACEKYEKAIDIKPDKHESFYNWGNALGELADLSEGTEKKDLLNSACEKYEKAIDIKPDKHESFYNWGIALGELADLSEGTEKKDLLIAACEKYEKAIDIKPDKHESFYNWGIALGELADLSEGTEKKELLNSACEKYEKAIDIKPDNHESFNNWGIALRQLADLSEGTKKKELLNSACEKYEKAIDIKPDKHESFNNWGNALGELADLSQGTEKKELLNSACEKYEKAIDIKPDKHESFNNWGNALRQLADLSQGTEKKERLNSACEKYEKAIDIKPDKHESFNNWGNALGELADLSQGTEKKELLNSACEKYEKAIDIKPDNHESFNNWGIALRQLADLSEGTKKKELLNSACEKYEKAIDIKPDNHESFNNWGNALRQLADLSQGTEKKERLNSACEKYEKAIDIKPDKHESFYNWGIALRQLADLSEGTKKKELLNSACEKYEKAIDIKPDNHESFNNWGIALRQLADLNLEPEKTHLLTIALEKVKKAESIKEGIGIFNMACLFSLLGEKEKALSCLVKTIEFTGSNEAVDFQDRDLDALRDDERFIRLTIEKS